MRRGTAAGTAPQNPADVGFAGTLGDVAVISLPEGGAGGVAGAALPGLQQFGGAAGGRK